MSHEYKQISKKMLEQAHANAWSIENMAAHGAEDREVEYVGSIRQGNIVFDYYRDNVDSWWYQSRGIVGGSAVSMDVYIFGKEIKKERTRKWNRNY